MTTSELVTAAAALVTSCEDLSPEDFSAYLDRWVSGAGDKIAALRAVTVHLDGQAAARKAEAEAWADAARRSAAQSDRVKALAGELLDAAESVGEVLAGARWQANGGAVPLRFAPGFDATALPFAYQRVTVEPDTAAIRTAMQSGEVVPGVDLGERGRHVRWVVGGGK